MTMPTEDLSLFADLGTDLIIDKRQNGDQSICMRRNGVELEIISTADGSFTEYCEGEHIANHNNIQDLLASPNFGNLSRWADSQKAQLNSLTGYDLPISGELEGKVFDLKDVETSFIAPNEDSDRIKVLLIDGPAGIGKTFFIKMLAHMRACNYKNNMRPLILHVESRGRMLQNIMDLVAFSLQTLRTNIMYDQLPVFIRHGLITLAIDGFDELADPSGYELAWASVNNILATSRGRGSIILSGRETFIGKARLVTALTALREDKGDSLEEYTINLTPPERAKKWLIERKWPEDLFDLPNIAPIFAPDSYALRPFYLDELSRPGVADQIRENKISSIMEFLVESMIRREQGKFGSEIESASDESNRVNFIRKLLGEVARDLAENQTEAISSTLLSWYCEMTAPDYELESFIDILKNRVMVLAFLTEDQRIGYKKFNHPKLLNYFLSNTTIDCIAKEEIPKYIRRNIFGIDFFQDLNDVISHEKADSIKSFFKGAINIFNNHGDYDRTRRNIAAIIMATSALTDNNNTITLSNVSVDEAIVPEISGNIKLQSVSIAQLDARDADLRAMQFDSHCYVIVLIANSRTLLPMSFPNPTQVQDERNVLTAPGEINRWISARKNTVNSDTRNQGSLPENLKHHPIMELIRRICRYRSFWLRDTEENVSRRILDDENWPLLREHLETNGFLVVENNREASGQRAEFFHFRHREHLMDENTQDQKVLSLFNSLSEAIQQGC